MPINEMIAMGPGVITWGEPDSGTYYEYRPERDITVYELAVLTPYLSPRISGRDASRKAAVESVLKSIPGSVCGATVLRLYKHDVEDIGEAMRHLRAVGQ